MTDSDDGLIEALVKRVPLRLERALALKQQVDGGARLGDNDLAFLGRVFEDARKILPLVDRHPEYQDLAARMLDLYHQITTQALDNESQG